MGEIIALSVFNLLLNGGILLVILLRESSFRNNQERILKSESQRLEQLTKSYTDSLTKEVKLLSKRLDAEVKSFEKAHTKAYKTMQETNSAGIAEYKRFSTDLSKSLIGYGNEVQKTNKRLIEILKRIDASIGNYEQVKPLLESTYVQLEQVIHKNRELVSDNEKSVVDLISGNQELLEDIRKAHLDRMKELSSAIEKFYRDAAMNAKSS